MTRGDAMIRTIKHVFVLGFALAAGPALAGNAGAGPGGTGSSVVGASITPGAVSGALFETLLPGLVGSIALTTDQTAALAAYMRDEGATENGGLLTAAITFQDETPGTMTLDSAAGTLTFSRD